MESSILSLIPPVFALIMVIFTRRVLLSLGVGIVIGALMVNEFQPLQTAASIYAIVMGIFFDYGDVSQVTFTHVTSAIIDSGFQINTWEFFIILFLLILGMISSLISSSGGSLAFGEWAMKRVKTRVGASLLPIFLGLIIFIDDYFNSLTVGNVSRPLTDRHRISRAKLAYYVDSTAAPMCVIAPVSSWGAYIITIIATILATYQITDYGALQAFVMMIPMNFYAVIALAFVFAVAWFKLDIGEMKMHETRALETGELYSKESAPIAGGDENVEVDKNGKVGDLIWPIVALIIGTVFFMIITGIQGSDGEVTLLSIFENTDVSSSLVYGGIFGLLIALILKVVKPSGTKGLKNVLGAGANSMLPAIYILIFAWTIISIIGDLGTGEYLASLVERWNVPIMFLPVALFIIAGFTAFSTGSSWGTFGLLLPIAGQMASVIDMSMLLPMLAAVLAGSIFGDHCSPISDTTILSSAGAGSHHIDHVVTQLPYAVIVAVISVVAYFVLGVTGSVMLGLVTAFLLLAITIVVLKKYCAANV